MPFNPGSFTYIQNPLGYSNALLADLRVVSGASYLPYASSYSVPTGPLSPFPSGTTVLLVRCTQPPPAPPPINVQAGGYTGFDIIFVAGQSNAVGSCPTPDVPDEAADAIGTRPIYQLTMGGSKYYPWDGNSGDGLALMAENIEHMSVTDPRGGGYNSFASSFAIRYVDTGRLAKGRALLVVNAAFGGTGILSSNPYVLNYPWPSSSTNLVWSWAPDATCNSAVAGVTTAYAAVQYDSPRMSLFTHSLYRMDFAMSLDPGTLRPTSGQGFTYQHPANKVVAMLWHQGENESACGKPRGARRDVCSASRADLF